jgi:hypothetical protein
MQTEIKSHIEKGFGHVQSSRHASQENFVLGTAKHFWQNNPFGFLIQTLPPKKTHYENSGDGPAIIAYLFCKCRVQVVTSIVGNFEVTLEQMLAGYDFFPHDFRPDEISRLESQLKEAKLKVGAYALQYLRKTRG